MRMKFWNKEYQQSKIQSARTPLRLKSNVAPRLFSLTVFYRGLKHEHVTDFSGRNRLLSSWIINEFLNSYLLSDETQWNAGLWRNLATWHGDFRLFSVRICMKEEFIEG